MAVPLHYGSARLPPMVQVNDRYFPELDKGIVKPPSPEDLWDWYEKYYGDNDPDPSWGKIWDSAKHLGQRICDVEGKTIVELGCGLGLVGVCAAKKNKVILVDREPFALHCACATASLNGLTIGTADDDKAQVAAIVATFDDLKDPQWRRDKNFPGKVDLIVASDVLYDNHVAMDNLAATCEALLDGEGSALIADPLQGRAFGARTSFLTAAKNKGAHVHEEILLRDALEPTVLITLTWGSFGSSS